nr:hypothetical protein [Frisingicoccus sp.]
MNSRLLLKITSALLFILGILSALSLFASFATSFYILEQLTASKETMQFTLYVLILGLVGLITLVLQFMAAVKGWKAASGKDFPDSCKTYGIILLVLQIISIISNFIFSDLTAAQIISSIIGVLILAVYVKSSNDLII